MKPLRIIVRLIAVIATLLAVMIAVLSFSKVQTGIVRQWLLRQAAFTGTVEKVDVGLQSGQLEKVQLNGEGWVLTIPSAKIELPIAHALRKRVLVRRFVAHGWTLDFSKRTIPTFPGVAKTLANPRPLLATLGVGQIVAGAGDAESPASALFQGIFPLLDLPVDLTVDQVDLEGEILFRSQLNGPIERIHVVMTGGGLAPGRTAQFDLSGDAQVMVPASAMRAVNARTTLKIRAETYRTFASLECTADLNAGDPRVGGTGPRLLLRGAAERTGGHENYLLTISSGGSDHAKALLTAHAEFPDAKGRMSGTWNADSRDLDFAPFVMGAPLPAFALRGTGVLDAEGTFQELHTSGMFAGKVARWEIFDPSLASLGELQLQASFDLFQRGRDLRIERLSAQIADTQPILSVDALQGIEFNGDTGELKVADPRRDLMRVTLSAVPISWLQPFSPRLSLNGGPLRGELIGQARDSGLLLRSATPLTITHVAIEEAGQRYLRNVDVSLNLSGVYSPEGWQADVSALELRTAGRLWFAGAGKVGAAAEKNPVVKGTGHYQLDLAASAQQPAFRRLRGLRKGVAEGDFSAVLGDVHRFAASAEISQLEVEGFAGETPKASVLARADIQPSGVTKLQIPFQIQHAQRHSEGQLSAEVRRDGSRCLFEAQFTSDLVSADDLAGLTALLAQAADTPDKVSAPAQSTSADDRGSAGVGAAAMKVQPAPFWTGYEGRVLLGVKKVASAPGLEATDLTGDIKFEAASVLLERIGAHLPDGGTALLNGTLTFNPAESSPYALSGQLDLSRVNPAPYMTSLAPGEKATIEGIFDLTAKFSTSAPSIDLLGNQLTEEVKLTSRGGRFRGFAVSSRAVDFDKLQRTASTVGALLQAAAGMVGYGPGVSYSEKLRAAADALRGFSDIGFDQLNLELAHEPGQETKISDISLISPEIRFSGNGTMDTESALSWFARPLHLDVAVAVRGKQAENLRKLNLIDAEKDSLGYTPLLDKFPIDGSAVDLSTDAFGKLLNRALAK